MTRDQLETLLGPAATMIATPETVPYLREWASFIVPISDAALMGVPQLTNLYHARGPQASPSSAALNEVVMRCIEALARPVEIDAEAIREMVRQEVEAIAPRRLEIVTPAGNVQLTGSVHYRTELVLRIVGCGHPIMMVGPAGCGKTTIGERVAQALNLPFYITSTINDTHELTGFIDGHGHYHSSPFRQAFEHGGVWVADEIDAWDAPAFLAANSALANGFAVFPDAQTPIRRHANFRMVATANTFGTGADRVYVGRNELDAASLDRFAVVEIDYDMTLERMFANGADRWLERVWSIRKIVQEKKIRHVVSSRCIGMGAAALAAGIAWEDVENIYLWKGISTTDRRKCE